MKILSIILAAAILAGCSNLKNYEKQDITPEQDRKNRAECDYEAKKATAGAAQKASLFHETNEIINLCLELKGYSPVQKK